jgi:tetratricopeptide (TPR) repeat protein
MSTLAHTIAADAVTAKARKCAMFVSLAVIAVTVASGFVCGQLGRTHFAPTFAKELTPVSELRIEAGDYLTALAASRKATEVYRRLMRGNAVQYAPHLAATLHNLSVRLSEAGDHPGALAAIDEAIRIRRRLAEMNPARYALGLERSVRLLSPIEAASRSDASTLANA